MRVRDVCMGNVQPLLSKTREKYRKTFIYNFQSRNERTGKPISTYKHILPTE